MTRLADAAIIARHPRCEIVVEQGVAFVAYPRTVERLRELRETAKQMGGELRMSYQGGNRESVTEKQRRANHAIFARNRKG